VIATVMAAVVLVAAFIKGAVGFGFPAPGHPDGWSRTTWAALSRP